MLTVDGCIQRLGEGGAVRLWVQSEGMGVGDSDIGCPEEPEQTVL